MIHAMILQTTSPASEQRLEMPELVMPAYEHTHVGMLDDKTGYWTMRVYADCVALNDIWVMPGHRNQGLGAVLLEQVIEHANELGKSIALYCAPDQSLQGHLPKKHQAMDFERLRSWYMKRGFDRHPDFKFPELLYRPVDDPYRGLGVGHGY
jgi:GNAT superfamily N-acetyltransferase